MKRISCHRLPSFFPCHRLSSRAQHVRATEKKQSPRLCAPERLTDLYTQLQGVMPLLRDIVQPEKVEEGTALYATVYWLQSVN